MSKFRSASQILFVSLAAMAAPVAMLAVPPIQVYTVPWIATSPATPHYSWNGKAITLKGTANLQDTGSGTIQYDWNPGDGGTHCTGVVTNQFIIECPHTYSGASVGTVFNATLTVYDSSTSNGGSPPVYSNSGSASYYTQIYNPPPSLQTETNAAIDAGLWYLHKDMTRYSSAAVAALTLTNGGSGYESDGVTAPVVSFTGCTTSPTATAVVDNGGPITSGIITSIVLNSYGSGCQAPVTVTITDPLQSSAGALLPNTASITNGGQNYELLYGTYYSQYYGPVCCSYVTATFTGAGNTGSGASAYLYVDLVPSSPTYGQINSIYWYGYGSGYVNPVTSTVTDNYCSSYKNGVQEPYYDGICGTGGVVSVTAASNTFGTGATATVTLTNPVKLGDWSNCIDHATACGIPASGVTAANCTAFEVSGHLEGGPGADPYTDDVQRCMLGVFSRLQSVAVPNSKTNGFGTFDPDQNNNGLGATITEGEDMYQDGMIMDAIVASGTKNKPVTFGALAALTHPGGGGPYTYQDAVMDMTDWYVYCMNNGAWIYTCNSGVDNSVSQWAAIGLIGARRNFNSFMPADSLADNRNWLQNSQIPSFPNVGGGYFGYTQAGYIPWGPYADTPSGLVQLAMNGVGRSATNTPTQWDYSESFMRDSFDISQQNCASCDVKDYYYGMFSFTKSMLLHDTSGTGLGNTPIQLLQSKDNPGTYPPIDWYAAQNGLFGGSDTSNGVARTLISGTAAAGISGQNADGSWFGHNYSGSQYYFETAWAIIMLNRTVFQQVPSACATYSPNPATDAATVQLNGSCSVDPNPAPVTITTYQWDVSGTGGTTFTVSGVKPNVVLTAPGNATLPYSFPVRLRVTDSLSLTSDTVFNVVLNNPAGAAPPSPNAGGPYNFCPNYTPWYLDGSHSTQSGGFTITSYNWDFSCSGAFNSASGAQPRVDVGSPNLLNHAPGSFQVCLRVSNNTGIPQDTSSVANALVTVHTATDVECSHCVTTQSAKAKNFTPGVKGSAQIYWLDTNNALQPIDHYNIYRSSNASFSPFIQVAGASSVTGIPAIRVPAVQGSQLNFIDPTIPAPSSTPYYYRIAPATTNDTETCASPLTLSVVVGGRQ